MGSVQEGCGTGEMLDRRDAGKQNVCRKGERQERKAAGIEEVWRKKPRQTDVVVLCGKIAAHRLLFRLCSV